MTEGSDASATPEARARAAASADGAQGARYVILYQPGPAWEAGRPVAEQPLGPHRAFLRALFDEGRLALAGAFLDGSGGLAVLSVRDRSEAEETLASDPAVVSGVMVAELRPFYALFDRARPASPVWSSPGA